jgi:hypothetical protein
LGREKGDGYVGDIRGGGRGGVGREAAIEVLKCVGSFAEKCGTRLLCWLRGARGAAQLPVIRG